MIRKEGEEGPDFQVRSAFEDDLGHFMLEKDLQLKGLSQFITSQQDDFRSKFKELHVALDGYIDPDTTQKDPLLAITTRAGTTTSDPPYPTQRPNTTEANTPLGEEEHADIEPPEQPSQAPASTTTPVSQSPRIPYPSRLKKQKSENDNKRFLSYLKDSVVTIPLLDACYHMPKYSTYFRKLFVNRLKLEGLVTLGEECSAVVQ